MENLHGTVGFECVCVARRSCFEKKKTILGLCNTSSKTVNFKQVETLLHVAAQTNRELYSIVCLKKKEKTFPHEGFRQSCVKGIRCYCCFVSRENPDRIFLLLFFFVRYLPTHTFLTQHILSILFYFIQEELWYRVAIDRFRKAHTYINYYII